MDRNESYVFPKAGEIVELVNEDFNPYLTDVTRANLDIVYKNSDGSIAATLPPELATAAILTGPEGGLTEAEVDKARQAGVKVCTLGKRILRCETAPLCALSALFYAAGELE